mgnify:CR=1 FL=1
MRRRITTLVILMLCGWFATAIAENSRKSNLPHREALSVEVDFWKQVFTKYSSNQYLIHDSERLNIIYKLVSFDSTLSDRRRGKRLKAIKKEIKDLLLKFHSKKYNAAELTSWEKQVYQQFIGIKDKNKFLIASKRIRAQQGIRENFLAGVTRSFAYLPHIKKAFAEYGIPQELIYLPHVESSFNPIARSHVGATGMWQFMRGTARSYMKVNRIKDERYDPLISTKAAARLLKYNYRKLNDWALAITAYNHGLGSMKKAKRRHGSYLNIREKYLRRSFGFASKNFYPEVLAVVEICDSIDHYFPNIKKDPVLLFQEITVSKPVALNKFAKTYNIDFLEFKRLNPGFRSQVWRGSRRVPANYTIRLPLTADPQHILASLGASKDDFGKITRAKKDPHQEKIVLLKFKDLQARRVAIKRSLADFQTGVEPPITAKIKSELIPQWYALEDNQKPAILNSEAPLLATKSTREIKSPKNSEWINFSKPLVAETNDNPVFAENFRFEITLEIKNAVSVSRSENSSLNNLFAFFKPGVENNRQFNTIFDFQTETVTAKVGEKQTSSTPSYALNKHNVEYKSPYLASLSNWKIAYNTQEIPRQQIFSMLKNRLSAVNTIITVYPQETLGHFSEWLNIDINHLRRMNNISYHQKLYTGQKLQLDFSEVPPNKFLEKRLNFHVKMIGEYLEGNKTVRLIDYTIKPGESLWSLAHKKSKFPVNLLLYFNDLDKLERLYPGEVIKLPVMYH